MFPPGTTSHELVLCPAWWPASTEPHGENRGVRRPARCDRRPWSATRQRRHPLSPRKRTANGKGLLPSPPDAFTVEHKTRRSVIWALTPAGFAGCPVGHAGLPTRLHCRGVSQRRSCPPYSVSRLGFVGGAGARTRANFAARGGSAPAGSRKPEARAARAAAGGPGAPPPVSARLPETPATHREDRVRPRDGAGRQQAGHAALRLQLGGAAGSQRQVALHWHWGGTR